MEPERSIFTRRRFLRTLGAGIFTTTLASALPVPAWALPRLRGANPASVTESGPLDRYDLEIDYMPFVVNGRKQDVRATAINGTIPGPLIHLREGEHVKLYVTNRMMDTEHTSIHWHGILVPFPMDGVPGVNFKGIPPGRTYHYNYTLKQAGTYWYHSHSKFQEQTGMYGAFVIEPKGGDPIKAQRDYVVVLSDWTEDGPEAALRNIIMDEGYYNFQQRTMSDFFRDAGKHGFSEVLADRLGFGEMRMSPVDFNSITGFEYTYLMNGHDPASNWTGIFNPGETVRLRFINASAMSTYDVRIPGLDMQVVMVDGKRVKPVSFHEFRIGVAETYDVLVRPRQDKPYTIFAESQDRSGYARGTLSPEPGLQAEIPKLRPRPVRTLEDIGMGMMDDKYLGRKEEMKPMMMEEMKKMEQKWTPKTHALGSKALGPKGPEPFKPDKSKVNVAMVVMMPKYRYHEPGVGLGDDGWKVLTYADLASAEPQPYPAKVDREMTINITANMDRFMFSLDGLKYTEQPGPYLFQFRERLRLWMVNHTMMEHPMHLHGMWMQIENNHSHDSIPFKHTYLIKPGEKVSMLITPIEKGDWAYHCHLLYHMEAGMFQVVRVA